MRLEQKFVVGVVGYGLCMCVVAVVLLVSRTQNYVDREEEELCGWISCQFLDDAQKSTQRLKEETIKALTAMSTLPNKRRCKMDRGEEVAKIGIITLSSGENYEVVGPATSKNKREYAETYGYAFYDESQSPHLARVAGWSHQWKKIPTVLGRLKDQEWLLWLDSDVVVMNFEMSIESRFPVVFPTWSKQKRLRLKEIDPTYKLEEEVPAEEIHLILSADDIGINTGTFLIRNCPWSFQFLEEVLKEKRWSNIPYHEQTTMLKLMEKNPEHRKHILLDGTLSSFGVIPRKNEYRAKQFSKGDWLVHMTGACRVKARCENKVLPLVRLSEAYREEQKWKNIHKSALLSLSASGKEKDTEGCPP